jgi:hypothetical protein
MITGSCSTGAITYGYFPGNGQNDYAGIVFGKRQSKNIVVGVAGAVGIKLGKVCHDILFRWINAAQVNAVCGRSKKMLMRCKQLKLTVVKLLG